MEDDDDWEKAEVTLANLSLVSVEVNYVSVVVVS